MARVKLSEFRAKHLLFESLGLEYSGVSIDLEGSYSKIIAKLPTGKSYVVKVDQAIKKRGKQGLVKVKRSKAELLADLASFAKLGYRYALVEPFLDHSQQSETYLALVRTADGVRLSYSPSGGIDVEAGGQISQTYIDDSDYPDMPSKELVSKLYRLFQKTHMTLLEINPLVELNGAFVPLDAAVEVDSAGQFFVGNAWTETDIREAKKTSYKQEQAVEQLNANSPSSLTLRVLNPNGAVFLLLSGGGASVVVADELAHLGYVSDMANYGEYSGNPTTDETYIYTREILDLLLKSKARKKVLVIAGGVANFTDVAKTFAGIIKALSEVIDQLNKQKVKVVVRRGGPNQAKGLQAIADFLTSAKIAQAVYGPEKTLSKVVAEASKVVA